ncbi:ABC multidrug efflux transporter fused ATPase and inner membrane proteins [Ketogulonicigenium robustum]|uniref:ABC multidrug efflux transporter fused ATPase and inner membrane proteins n=2 Tax=Ketogulonicigenium robustum TaxID=92947 RepID=A0A1W6P2Q7_9RHOB|nr:ABC multidrug efflux transporter fused ATPase and inner membrane proteins [Ketogulonicigenium robustum]
MPMMLRQFFSYYKPWRRLFLLDFGSAVLSGILELAFPLAITWFIDSLLPLGDLKLTVFAAFLLAGVYGLNAFLMYVVIFWGHQLGINIETEMRRQAFDHLQKLSWSFFDTQRTGKLVARVTRDLEEIGEVAHHGPEDLFIAIMTFIGAFAMMAMLHLPLALLTLVIVPVAFAVVLFFGRRMTKTWRAIYARVAGFNVRLEENVGGIRVVQAFGNEEHERALFAKDNAAYRNTKIDAYRYMAGSNAVTYIGMRATQILVMVAGAAFVVSGSLTTGGFVGFLLLVNVFLRPLDKIATVIEMYPRGIAGFKNFQDLMATDPDIADKPTAIAAPKLTGDIRFDDVKFAYSDGRPVLRGISFAVNPGETVAFVGPSGAGKTSLLALLPRFYDVTEGQIRVDGHDIRDLQLGMLRAQIGLVSQDVYLFGGTLRENIAYGRLGSSDDEIMEAARLAQLADMIAGMPAGLDTVVGERGVMLSGGQKQRVAIARLFLKNPPILILDEATSALDTQTEREIQAALDRLAVGRTTLVIAHRLATIRNADRIFVMDQGQIVETGTHAELVAAGGHYAKLDAA